MALGRRSFEGSSKPDDAAHVVRLTDALAMHLGAVHSQSAAALVNGTGYAVLSCTRAFPGRSRVAGVPCGLGLPGPDRSVRRHDHRDRPSRDQTGAVEPIEARRRTCPRSVVGGTSVGAASPPSVASTSMPSCWRSRRKLQPKGSRTSDRSRRSPATTPLMRPRSWTLSMRGSTRSVMSVTPRRHCTCTPTPFGIASAS